MTQTCILFCPTDTWGGVEKNVRLRAKVLGEKGYRVVVVLLKNKFAERFRNLTNVEVISVKARGGDINLFVVKQYCEIINKYKPDIVFSALKKDWFLVSFAAYISKVPRIILYLGIKRNIRNGLKYRTVFNKFNAQVLVNSNALKEHLIQSNDFFSTQNVFRIYNGFQIPDESISSLNLRSQFSLSPEDYIIGCAGRFSPQKGFDLLPQILDKLPPNVHVVHAGGTSEESEIKRQLEGCAQNKRIHFLGYQENIIPFMKELDLFLLPSRWEGMANVLNEAMSVGKPIVSTLVSGSRELLANGQYGILCEIEDVDCLANAIIKIMNGDEVFSSNNQIERIRKSFSLDQMISQTEHLFFGNLDTFKETD